MPATKTSFPRHNKLFYSDKLDCDICLDSGSGVDIIPSSLLERFKDKGFIMEPLKVKTTIHLSNKSSIDYNQAWLITLPLSRSCFYRGIFYEGALGYLLLGRRIMESRIIFYQRDSVHLLDNYPEEYSKKFQLKKNNEQYYISLSVNDREHLFYLDTGHSDAVTLSVNDRLYAISPIREIKDEINTVGGTESIIDLEEERGELRIGDIIKHGPIVYADYYKEPYWFNPAMIFADFVLDLRNNIIGFMNNA